MTTPFKNAVDRETSDLLERLAVHADHLGTVDSKLDAALARRVAEQIREQIADR